MEKTKLISATDRTNSIERRLFTLEDSIKGIEDSKSRIAKILKTLDGKQSVVESAPIHSKIKDIDDGILQDLEYHISNLSQLDLEIKSLLNSIEEII